MKQDFRKLYEDVIRNSCDEQMCGRSRPNARCANEGCGIVAILNQIQYLSDASEGKGEGCSFCRDKNGNVKEQFWMPDRGGLRTCIYCPECGQIVGEE